MTAERVKAAEDFDLIRANLKCIRSEKQDILNRPEEGFIPKAKEEVQWIGCAEPTAEMRADWKRDAAVWQASVERSGR